MVFLLLQISAVSTLLRYLGARMIDDFLSESHGEMAYGSTLTYAASNSVIDLQYDIKSAQSRSSL